MAVKKSKGSADASFGKTKVSQRTLMTRVLCLVLALLMVASSVYIVLEMLLR